MYASATVSDSAAPRQRSFIAGPIFAICCLILILLAIACTIVLALIPVYLPRKEGTPNRSCELLYFVITSDSDLGEDGPLDAASIRSIGDAISSSLGYPQGTVELESAEVISDGGTRKRRKRYLKRSIRQSGVHRQQKIICRGRVNRRRSPICRSLPSKFSFTAEIVLRGIRRLLTLLIEVFKDPSKLPTPSTSTSTGSTTVTSTTASASTTPNMLG